MRFQGLRKRSSMQRRRQPPLVSPIRYPQSLRSGSVSGPARRPRWGHLFSRFPQSTEMELMLLQPGKRKTIEFNDFELLVLSAQLRTNHYRYKDRAREDNTCRSGALRDLRTVEALIVRVEAELAKRGYCSAIEEIQLTDRMLETMQGSRETSESLAAKMEAAHQEHLSAEGGGDDDDSE